MNKRRRNSVSDQAWYGIFSIANQLRYGTVLLVAVALMLASGTLIFLGFQAQLQQLNVVQQERSQSAASAIDGYLDDLQRKLSYLARVRGLTNLSPEIQQRFLEALTRHNSAYEAVAILDRTGQVVSVVSPYRSATFDNLANAPLFSRAFKQQADVVSPVEIDPVTQLPVVTLAMPIRNQFDAVDGVLLARINLRFLWFFIYQTDVGKTGYAYVIDNRNFLIAAKGKAPEPFTLQNLSDHPFMQEITQLSPAVQGARRSTPMIYQGLRGVEVVGAIAPIHSLHWKVIVELPTAEAYAPVRNMLFVMGAALSLATVVAGGLGVFFSRQIILPLQRLTQAAARIRAGNLDTQVKLEHRNELGVLAKTFNEMTTQLRGLIEELSQERNFVSAILDTAGALVLVVDWQGRIVRFNRACEETTHYSFEEVKSKYFWDLFLIPAEVPRIKAVFDQLRTGEFPNTYENCWVTKEGHHRLIRWSNTALLNADHEIEYIIAIGIDSTERRQAEEALLLSEEKFAKAFRSSPDAITITTIQEGRLIDVNDSFLRIMGYSREEVIDHTVFELNMWVNPIDRLKVKQLLQDEGAVYNLEFEFRKKSGETGIGLFSAEIINLGDQLCMLAVTNDITERKRTEEQLRASTERDRLLGEIALRIRHSLDLDQILNTTVREVREFLQADRVFIGHLGINSSYGGQVFAESVAPGWDPIYGVFLADETYIQELKIIFSQGTVQAIDDVTQAQLSPKRAYYFAQYQVKACLAVSIMLGDEFFGALVAHQCSVPRHWEPMAIDLLEKLATQVAIAIQQAQLYQEVQAFSTSLERQVEERTAQLQQKMQELQELYQMKDVFLHAFSHDLRTPIMGTSLVLQNLLNQPGETLSLSRAILQRIIQSNERQLNLINALLEAHSSEVGGLVLHDEPIQLTQLIQVLVEDLEPVVAKNQGSLTNLVPHELPIISADPTQLRRVFENLITNALKHNPPGLHLTLNATIEDHSIRCEVIDNGIGMSQEQCEHLFDLYYRGGNTRHFTGIGLGLYLCRQIIKAHGGEIGVISSPGNGATFWFSLPLGQ